MGIYEIYSKYYDDLNKDYSLWLPFISSRISAYPKGSKLIEFGCGTGNILIKFKDSFSLHGVDISEEMLSIAKEKLPQGIFYREDMVTFKSSERFEVALCLFDSINHILDFKGWIAFLASVSTLLAKNGIFILDMNTGRRVARIDEYPPVFQEFDGNYFFMQLRKKTESRAVFDVRILKNIGEGLFRQETEFIEELTPSGFSVYSALSSVFTSVQCFTENKMEIRPDLIQNNETNRLFFACGFQDK